MAAADRAKAAWARLAGLKSLDDRLVFVDETSPFCPRGWIGILSVGGIVVASVPRADLREPVMSAIAGLSPVEATTPEVVSPRLPPMLEVMGPAALFYPDDARLFHAPAGVFETTPDELTEFLRCVPPADVEESGLGHITSPAFGTRAPTGELAAVCGYTHWPDDVGHTGVLTHPDHRRAGHGRVVAEAAIAHAQDAGLLPQWRARPAESQALARRLGLIELGAQLSLRPADAVDSS